MNNCVPITINRDSSPEERESALVQIYRQVLERQPFESERQSLASAESDFLKGKIGVRRFIHHLADSDLYLNAFYYSTSNPKFLECCFKHFLGRAILDQAELQFYSNVLAKRGVHELISTILDSEDYRKLFGGFTVPYPQQKKCYESPNVYLESEIVNHEHHGQRGWSLPTLYWRQLGLICAAGACHHPDEALEFSSSTDELSEERLLELLRSIQQAQPLEDELVESLSY